MVKNMVKCDNYSYIYQIANRYKMKIFNNIVELLYGDNYRGSKLDEYFHIATLSEMKEYRERESFKGNMTLLHKRDFYEIAVIISSASKVRIGDNYYADQKNNLNIISPFQLFSLERDKDDDIKKQGNGYLIFFKPELFSSLEQAYELHNEFPFFSFHTSPVYKLSPTEMHDILYLAEQLYLEAREDKINRVEVIRSYLILMLYKIKRLLRTENSIVSINRHEEIASKFDRLLIAESGKYGPVSYYSGKMNISSVYLSECVKKATGKSAKQIIIEFRILYIKSVLKQSNTPISIISERMGFTEVTNFTKYFKKYTGKTPLQFRREKN